MERNKINYFIDIGLVITFLLFFITGIFKFPQLSNIFTGVFRIIPYRTLSKIHDWSGLIMGLLVLVHLTLHFRWLVAMTKNVFKKKEVIKPTEEKTEDKTKEE